MSEAERFGMLLTRTSVGYPRGVLGFEARALARALADGDAAEADRLRPVAAAVLWPEFRLAIGAALRRARGSGVDPTLDDALALVDDADPANPLSVALAEAAAASMAAVMRRTDERVRVLERSLADEDGGDDAARTVGDIVVDLLDLDVEDYEDEITAYVGAGESDAARDALARATGDEEIRAWAREELRSVTDGMAGPVARALAAMAHGDPPEDPAQDAVWVAAALALVEDAVEIATVSGSQAAVEGEDTGDGEV